MKTCLYYTERGKLHYYQAVMDLIVRANWEQMEEGRNMCEALRELFADELEKSREIAMEQNRIGDIVKAANDAEYQKSLFEEFGLQSTRSR